MILLALLLGSIGAADLVRPQDRAAKPFEIARAVIVGSLVVALGTWGTGIDWWWALIGIALLAAWICFTPSNDAVGSAYPWPLVGLALVVGVILAGTNLPEADGWLTRWYADLDIVALRGVEFETFVVAVGYLVFLIDSANIVVRMVLAGTDAGVIASERTLRGGRVLGPIERIFLVSMALAGQYMALTAVIAAKGILRFPEISRDTGGTKAEYVLVGSFVSWALALALVPIL